MTKTRIRYVQGPALRRLKEVPRLRKIEVPVSKRSLDLGVPAELVKRNDATNRFNILSYFTPEEGAEISASLRDRRRAKRQNASSSVGGQQHEQQQFDMSPLKDGCGLRARYDSLSLCSSSSSIVLVTGAHQQAFNESLEDSPTAPAKTFGGLSISESDLQQILQKWQIDTRSRGSEVGASKLGRELQKLYPSEILPSPGASITVDRQDVHGRSQLLLPHRRGTDGGGTGEGPHLPQITAHFATLARWQIGTNRPIAQVAHLEAINSITLREGALMRLVSVVGKMDERYWRYSVCRLKAAALHLPLHTRALVNLRRKLAAVQDECRVALAHYRGTTVQAVGDMQKWRQCCQQESQTRDSVEMLWGGVNYYEKMKNDVDILSSYTVTRLWFNHQPCTFFIPPCAQSSFDPAKTMRAVDGVRALDALLRSVGEKVEALQREREREAQRSLGRSRDDEGPVGVLDVQKNGYEKEEEEEEEEEKEARADEGHELEDGEAEADGPGPDGQPGGHLEEGQAEWQVLRDYCVRMWGMAAQDVVQGPAPQYSEALLPELNGNAVQCYLGFPEVWPANPLLPLLPEALVEMCTRQAVFIKRELATLAGLRATELAGAELRRQVEEDLRSDRNLLNQPELQDPSTRHLLLRQRQEGGSLHRPSSLAASDFFAMTSTQSQESLTQTQTQHSLLMQQQQQQQQPLGSLRSASSAPLPLFSGLPSSSALAPTDSFENLFFTADRSTALSLPRLDAHRIQAQLQHRVADQRQIVARSDLRLPVKTIRPDVLAKRPPDFTKEAFRRKCAVQLQKIVRAFFGRRRYHKANHSRLLNQAAAKIQKRWRGIWGRARFRQCLRDFRIQSLQARKVITNKDDSALKIMHFIRYIGESSVYGEEKARAMSPVFSRPSPDRGVYKSLSRKSPKKLLAEAAAASAEPLAAEAQHVVDREMLKPYLIHYHDTANIIKDPSLASKKCPELNLASKLDTRLQSRLIPKASASKIKPFSARGRVFAETLGVPHATRCLAERTNDIYLVPPCLATPDERVHIAKALGKSSMSETKSESHLDLRLLLGQC